jgi:hypothetical protein
MPEAPDDWFNKRTDEELRDIRKLLGEVVPRRELELRWDVEIEYRVRMQKQLDEVNIGLKDLATEVREGHKELSEKIDKNETTRLQGQLPKWFVPTLALFVPVVTALVVHFIK